ncbi:LysR family transcriptional regulator [Magnetospirillum sp. ME-1]|uniref:LysR substrate-binding domain-containing protein n=1 Tax=Magnetospirillum sp. ME-1 TaxID=1639348 RepID=UPI000A17F587|nr:LysR substrate-binding domain-containing protein [Magnetospirillum sp. ME-1]ARJ67402.1 LysR family transcriptional regulator [Magnetospirillum sp. ME-1]
MSGALDIAFFAQLARHASLTAAAREMGLSPPAISRRLAALEGRLGVRLLNRTTRRQSLTPEGEKYLEEGRRILGDIESLERDLVAGRQSPRGSLRINAGFGFGRRHLGPAVSDFVRLHPEVEVILHLSDRPLDLTAEAMDIGIRFGLGPDSGLVRRKIAANRRLLCAAPAYLAAHAPPLRPKDLRDHHCIVIRENEGAFNTWNLVSAEANASVKVGGALSANHGEVAVDWALAGHGILLRSEWDIAPYLRSGELVRVLDSWSGVEADIHAVFLQRHQLSAKVRCFLDFLAERFASQRAGPGAW